MQKELCDTSHWYLKLNVKIYVDTVLLHICLHYLQDLIFDVFSNCPKNCPCAGKMAQQKESLVVLRQPKFDYLYPHWEAHSHL